MQKKITMPQLKKIIGEELRLSLKEAVDHASIREVVNDASKLLAAVEAFKKSANGSMMNALTPQISDIEKVLEDMVSTPGSYVEKQKTKPQKVSLKPAKSGKTLLLPPSLFKVVVLELLQQNEGANNMAKKQQNQSLFKRLTRLFKSGPVIKKKIRNADTSIAVADKTKSSGTLLFQKSLAPTYATITANAYNLSERLMRYQDYQEMEMCISGDTKIAVPNGYKTIRELAEECENDLEKTFIVYSYDHNKGQIVPALGKQARQTSVDHAWKVTFDSGLSITTSAGHRLMLRDGTYRKLEELQVGDSMMPFYRKDLFANENNENSSSGGYSWIYTMDSAHKSWTREHVLIAEWVSGRRLSKDECVHHINFIRSDNRPENLLIMDKFEHSSYHAKINNEKKWHVNNKEWIEKFKKTHSEWMKVNNPAERRDVTFGRILETCEKIGFNQSEVCSALDVSVTVVQNRLKKHGFSNFELFAKTYCNDWKNSGWNNSGENNPRFDKTLTFACICNAYTNDASAKKLADMLGTTVTKIMNRIRTAGYKNYSDFSAQFTNHKIESIEYVGVIPLYDLTVDGYKNFATDSVVSHNTPEISSALDIYADETVAADEKGRALHIYSDNERVKEILEDLFYGTLNLEFNLRSWARNLPVHKDTVIPLLDGRNITIEQLAKEHKEGKENWVYSVQDGTHRTVPGKVAWCDLTRKDSELVRVWLDDGAYIDCTPDHEFVLRDGSRKQAQGLMSGESLMPFYRKTSSRLEGNKMDGYEEVYDPRSDRYVYTHRRVAEVLEEGTLNDGRWLVTHHKDFDKRNNDPQNLVRMDEKEHMKLHCDLAIKKLHSPEVTAKRMAGIDRWLRSDEHRELAKGQLKVLQEKGLMKTSWKDYNVSSQAKQDNVKRSELKKAMWSDASRRAKAQASMAIKFDQRCVDMIVERLEAHGKYVSPKVLGNQLKADGVFMGHFKSLNNGTKRDLTKPLNSHSGFEALLQKAGVSSYIELVKARLPVVAETPWFKRAEKKSVRMSGIVPEMREPRGVKLNHKVDRVERLAETSDVYCMEVLGANGEHDRHNFAVVTHGGSLDNGTFVGNCKYGDFFLYNDVSDDYGVVSAFPIPVNEIEREENYDREDPFAVRYRWVTLGNRILENWEVSHFRLLGNDMFLPYGSSVIEPARRIWRQLILIEDAMLVYRVVRAPERRVFYIDVGNIPASEVELYVEQQRKKLRTNQVIDSNTGRVDLRYNPMCVSMDSLIKLQDGRSLDLATLVSEWESGKQDQWVYSVDLEGKQIVPGKIVWAGKTRKDAEITRVHLDNGSFIDTTPDHKWMLRDGTYRRADELKSDDSLMPLYTKLSSKSDGNKIDGYEKIYDPFSESYVLTHRNNVITTQGSQSVLGKVVHHADYNKRNNSPNNLVLLTNSEHAQVHAEHLAKRNASPEGRKISSNRMKKTWAEGKINQQMFVDLWVDSDIRKRRVNSLTLNVGDHLLEHCLRIMDELKSGLSTKEQEFLDAINADDQIKSYLTDLNPKFKNGYVNKFTHTNLQIFLRKVGLSKSLESLKRLWLKERFKIDDVKAFCESVQNCSRKNVLEQFNLNRSSFEELVRLNGENLDDFRARYLPGSSRYTKKTVNDVEHVGYMNHKVKHVEHLVEHQDTGCITVEKYHNFAIAGKSAPEDIVFVKNSVDEDYLMPVRGAESGTKIETLAGGQNTAAVEDVAYIQKKLFAALKIPRAYLGYDEALSSKATLAQEDIRFSRTISVIQKTIISELNKLAIIHLYAHGFDGEDLQNFTLRLSNPSTVAQQQKLELWRSKFEIAGSAPEGFVDKNFIRKEIWGLNEEQCKAIDDARLKDKIVDSTIEAAAAGEAGAAGGDAGVDDLFGGGGGEASGGEEAGAGDAEETPPEENAGEEPEEEVEPDVELLTSADSFDDDEVFGLKVGNSVRDVEVPVKAQKQLDRVLYNRGRLRTHGASKTFMPDLEKMTSNDEHESLNDPFDSNWMKSVVSNPFGESRQHERPIMTSDMMSILRNWSVAKRVNRATTTTQKVITESNDDLDVTVEFDEVFNDDEPGEQE